ncbi:CARDB domain-containing protein [Corallincola platygyrae]|uniref:CARDB domain-containing protein n=1 Tax=Corallincola platygyrae TaxID=1193278 RepID=A0ABW4XQD3_9GAMM
MLLRKYVVLICCSAFLFLASCSDSDEKLPDLTIAKTANFNDPIDYCDRTGKELKVTVQNDGDKDSAALVEVKFAHISTPVSNTTVTIPAGEKRSTKVTIPSIPAGDFSFTAKATPVNGIQDKNPSNNEVKGHCIT